MSVVAVTAVFAGASAVLGGVVFWLIPGMTPFPGVLAGGALGTIFGVVVGMRA